MHFGFSVGIYTKDVDVAIVEAALDIQLERITHPVGFGEYVMVVDQTNFCLLENRIVLMVSTSI